MYRCFHKKNVLITGGTKGIGNAIANLFYNEGANVNITGTANKANKFKKFNYIKCNFLEENEFNTFLNNIKDLKIDILVNNAGINIINEFQNIKSSEFLNLHRVNTYSPFKICQSVLPNMKKKKWGRIINISSIWGKISKEHRASYSSSKFGLDGITASLAAEVAKDCILVNSVSPGFIETELTNKILGHSGIKKMSSLVPMKRLGKPEEIAKLVIWLSSSENTYVSGQNILIDGGFNRV